MKKRTIFTVLLVLLLASCLFAQSAAETTGGERSITLYCYDTFSSEWGSGPTLIPLFEEETGIKVNVVSTGDAVEMLSRAIMEGDDCQADLIMGISDDQASTAYESGIFTSYESPELANVDDSLEFDPEHRLIPFDYGVFAFVWDSESDIPAPTCLDDLRDPVYKDKIILIDPRTSSVGLGLLLWTIDVYGEEFSEKHIRNMFLDRGLAYSRDVRSGRDRWSLTAARLGVCRVFGTLMPSAWNIILSPGVTPMTFQSEPSPTAFIESSLSSTVGMGVCMPAASSLEDMVHHRIMETKRTTSLPSAHPSSPSNLTRRSISPMASPTRSNLLLRSKAADASPNVSYPFENTVSGL